MSQTPDRLAAEPPKADRRPTERLFHGQRLDDPYAWLRAGNWQEVMRAPDKLAADIRAYLEAENKFCNTALAATKDLQETLFL